MNLRCRLGLHKVTLVAWNDHAGNHIGIACERCAKLLESVGLEMFPDITQTLDRRKRVDGAARKMTEEEFDEYIRMALRMVQDEREQ